MVVYDFRISISFPIVFHIIYYTIYYIVDYTIYSSDFDRVETDLFGGFPGSRGVQRDRFFVNFWFLRVPGLEY